MTDAELRDELLTLLVAGHETTATALGVGARAARPPPGRVGAAARAATRTTLDAVVKETLRLRPVLPIVLRRLKAPMRDRRLRAARGRRRRRRASTSCTAAPDLYPDPLAFRPERFLERPPGTYTWIPFGGGVRRCLGASFAQFEMEAVLRVLARRCARLEPDAIVPERTARRSITLVPAREGRVLVA